MQWFAQAPANIALIKYMGKKDEEQNIPDNPSLSYSINHLLTNVELETQSGKKDFWEPLYIPGAAPFSLPLPAQQRFLKHLERIKATFNYLGAFIVRSSNNFPHSSGLASSASSFAALTKCAMIALSELCQLPLPSIEEQARISRLGSGSSCRSFFSPWALWDGENVQRVDLPYTDLIHQVILISHAEKQVSSSEAHHRIKSSPHYTTRSHQATDNLKILLMALQTQDWKNAYEICWREFHDMHNLFLTCAQPFSYMTQESKDVLRSVQDFWNNQGDGPIVSMDAGPNIHLLYRPDQNNIANLFKQTYLVGNYDVL